MDQLRVADAIDEIFTLLRRANKYIDETQPWVLGRDPAGKERLDAVLYNLVETIRFAATLLSPYLPDCAEAIFKQLNLEPSDWDSLASFGLVKPGHVVGKAEILFARLDMNKKLEEIEARYAEPKEAVEDVPPVTIDEFSKVRMTVCRVLDCEKVKKSDKLLRFTLDDGSGTPRQILSGIAKYYEPDTLIGKTVLACTNLPPRKMMGMESNGMLLSAEKGDSLRLLILPDDIPLGATIC